RAVVDEDVVLALPVSGCGPGNRGGLLPLAGARLPLKEALDAGPREIALGQADIRQVVSRGVLVGPFEPRPSTRVGEQGGADRCDVAEEQLLARAGGGEAVRVDRQRRGAHLALLRLAAGREA